MIRMFLKLTVVIAAFAGSLLLLGYYFACAGAEGFIPWQIGCPLSLAILLLTGDLGEALLPQHTLVQKKVFRMISRGLFFAAICLWFSVVIYVVALVEAVLIILSLKKKKKIRELFAAYLQKQGLPADSGEEALIRYSLWHLLRDKPAWIIEAELGDTPGIRRFGSEDGVIIPEN